MLNVLKNKQNIDQEMPLLGLRTQIYYPANNVGYNFRIKVETAAL